MTDDEMLAAIGARVTPPPPYALTIDIGHDLQGGRPSAWWLEVHTDEWCTPGLEVRLSGRDVSRHDVIAAAWLLVQHGYHQGTRRDDG